MPRPSNKPRILEAAADLFSRKGFRATTVRDIAEQAGLVSGGLYAHIATKEDLLVEIVGAAAEEFEAALAPIVAGPDSPETKVRQAVRAHLEVVARSRARSRVFLDEWQALSRPRREAVQSLRNRYEQLWGAILQEGADRGSFGVEDLSLARIFVLSCLNAVNRWYRPEGRLPLEVVADHYATWILRVLKGPEGESRD
ncbi:MAG: TetR/AcrR family transcriptional regulator [Firmicutes bacterium]|nr:TetR family transcriptional regulator [Alicyclobacillaceae bacterium]MCL6496345.1 TetR/AcrR family transcriptional regulator [Bacillota bacterium]